MLCSWLLLWVWVLLQFKGFPSHLDKRGERWRVTPHQTGACESFVWPLGRLPLIRLIKTCLVSFFLAFVCCFFRSGRMRDWSGTQQTTPACILCVSHVIVYGSLTLYFTIRKYSNWVMVIFTHKMYTWLCFSSCFYNWLRPFDYRLF